MEALSGVYDLGEGKVVGVDRSMIEGSMTALCFAKVTKDKIYVIKNELIENNVDIKQFIDKHSKEVFENFEEE